MAESVLVLNAGSSSLKLALFQAVTGVRLAHGIVERIGEEVSPAALTVRGRQVDRHGKVVDHEAAMRVAIELFTAAGEPLQELAVVAVGHGTVSGQKAFLIRNSWGADWGENGHAWLTEKFLTPRLFATAILTEDIDVSSCAAAA